MSKSLRYLLEIVYQGSSYHGWQIQPNVCTIQEMIQKAIRKVLQKSIAIIGSSRTDTGVHAKQQYAHIDLPVSIDYTHFVWKLNAVLPASIAINSIYPVAPTMHARFDAIARTYEYTISLVKNPFISTIACYSPYAYSISIMQEASKVLLGIHNFKSFSKKDHTADNYQCTILEAYWSRKDHILTFNITANRFLHGMVRSIVGALMKIGLSKLSIKKFQEYIEQTSIQKLSINLAPAHGLCLTKVTYPSNILKIS